MHPCKTISRAVNLASPGDHIYLDGTDTDKYPYTCQTVTPLHTGIFISKSLSFKGYGPMPQVRCLSGSSLIFDGSDNDFKITLSGLFFNDTLVTFRGSSAEVDGCEFAGREQRVAFTVGNNTSTSIRIRNSLFWKNTSGLSVNITSLTNRNQNQFLILELKNTTFRENFVLSETDERRLITVESINQLTQSFKCKLTLDNVTFSKNLVTRTGLLNLNLRNGHLNMSFKDLVVQGNNHLCSFGDCTELVFNSNSATSFISGAYFMALSGRALSMTATNLSVSDL